MINEFEKHCFHQALVLLLLQVRAPPIYTYNLYVGIIFPCGQVHKNILDSVYLNAVSLLIEWESFTS